MRLAGFRTRCGARWALTAGAALWLAGTSGAAAAQEPGLGEKIEAALKVLGPHTLTAVRVVSLTRGQVLYERNADLSMNPASNQKLLTSAVALAKLGPDYRFVTRVLSTGTRKPDGTLEGRLVLKGGGDPVLETDGLAELADLVKAAGITRVTDGLRVDDSRFDRERLGIGWNWDDEPFYYSAQISALSVNRNVLKVSIKPAAKAGEPAEVEMEPLPSFLRIPTRPMTVPAGTEASVSVSRVRGKNELLLTGSIPVDARPLREREVTMEDPQLYAGALFRKLLNDRGIKVEGPLVDGPASEEAIPVAEHHSVPLSRIAALLNKPSDNLVAEMLLKELGFKFRGSGDAVKGSEVVEGWLKDQGIEVGGVKVNDGSGLSRMDLVTSRAVSELLIRADAAPWREAFIQSLPVAGVDGTLRNRMKGTAAEQNLKAKTGTLGHVSALGGYVTTAGGERLVLSILINNHPGPTGGANGPKRIEDRIAVVLAELQTGQQARSAKPKRLASRGGRSKTIRKAPRRR